MTFGKNLCMYLFIWKAMQQREQKRGKGLALYESFTKWLQHPDVQQGNTGSSILVSHTCDHVPCSQSAFHFLPKHIAGRWIISRAAGAWTGTAIRSQPSVPQPPPLMTWLINIEYEVFTFHAAAKQTHLFLSDMHKVDSFYMNFNWVVHQLFFFLFVCFSWFSLLDQQKKNTNVRDMKMLWL